VSQLGYSFTQVFAAGALLEGLVFLYVYQVIRNIRDEKAVKGKTTTDMIKDLFNTTHAKDAMYSVVKRRPGNVRMQLWILLLSHFTIMAPMMGEMGVMYLFGRYKFGWDSGDIAYFMTFRMVLGFFGNFISMGILGKSLQMSDAAIGIACCLSGLLANILFAGANSNFMMYLGPVVSILSSAAIIVPRSLIGKIIPSNEMGKVGSFMACLDSIVPLLSAPIYTMLYTSTFETFPGAFFLLSGFLFIPPLLAFAWVRSSEDTASKKK
jgi:PCFT/HCP family folate transporter-like MFS transporter 1/3